MKFKRKTVNTADIWYKIKNYDYRLPDIISLYANGLEQEEWGLNGFVDWDKINKAICHRWDEKKLQLIIDTARVIVKSNMEEV